MNSAPTQGAELDEKEHLRFQRISQMSRKSNTRVYKLKNYVNPTLRVESAPVAQWLELTIDDDNRNRRPCQGTMHIAVKIETRAAQPSTATAAQSTVPQGLIQP